MDNYWDHQKALQNKLDNTIGREPTPKDMGLNISHWRIHEYESICNSITHSNSIVIECIIMIIFFAFWGIVSILSFEAGIIGSILAIGVGFLLYRYLNFNEIRNSIKERKFRNANFNSKTDNIIINRKDTGIRKFSEQELSEIEIYNKKLCEYKNARNYLEKKIIEEEEHRKSFLDSLVDED